MAESTIFLRVNTQAILSLRILALNYFVNGQILCIRSDQLNTMIKALAFLYKRPCVSTGKVNDDNLITEGQFSSGNTVGSRLPISLETYCFSLALLPCMTSYSRLLDLCSDSRDLKPKYMELGRFCFLAQSVSLFPILILSYQVGTLLLSVLQHC